MSGLPEGWAWTTLESVAVLTTGSTPSTKNEGFYGGDIPFVKPGDLDRRAPIQCTDQSLTGEGAEQARLLRAGAVLVSCIGTLGKVGIAGVELASNQQINAAEFRPNVTDDRYGYYVCRTLKPWMESEASATTIAILNKGRFGEAPFPLAPLAEQKRIADKLDSVLARVDACRDRLDRIPALLKRFRQAVLAAATSGRLTEDWRVQEEVATWDQSETLGSVGTVTGGLTKNAKRAEMPLQRQYLRVANVQTNQFDLDDVAMIGLTTAEFEKTRLQAGDLLIVEGNGSLDQIGRVALWKGQIVDCSHQNHLIRWRAGPRLLAPFALYFLLSPEGRRQIVDVASSTTGLHTLSISKVSRLRIPIPSLAEQHEIVRRVEALFAFADRLEARCAAARKQAGQLTPALLAKAFRGELVPQDPADEPAAELLKRLAASRADAPKARRGKPRASTGA